MPIQQPARCADFCGTTSWRLAWVLSLTSSTWFVPAVTSMSTTPTSLEQSRPGTVELCRAWSKQRMHRTSRWSALRTDMLFAREQQSFTGHTIDALQTMADRLGFWPKLVFDRGFSNESIV